VIWKLHGSRKLSLRGITVYSKKQKLPNILDGIEATTYQILDSLKEAGGVDRYGIDQYCDNNAIHVTWEFGYHIMRQPWTDEQL